MLSNRGREQGLLPHAFYRVKGKPGFTQMWAGRGGYACFILAQKKVAATDGAPLGFASWVIASRKIVWRFHPALWLLTRPICPYGRGWWKPHKERFRPSGDNRKRKEFYRRRFARSRTEASPLPAP